MKRDKLSSVILWSVISAAFIGPGTVTTAASAGAFFRLELLWSIVFATVACIVLQEVSARIVISSGLTLGQAIEEKFGLGKGFWIKWLVGGSVILGCAAYEAGNILGGTAGLLLLLNIDGKIYTALLSIIAFIVLWTGRGKWISTLMTFLVGLMGAAFLLLASKTGFSFKEIISSSFIPTIPVGSELLTLGLVGTTIVPYNLFLGSGISKGQTIPLMRVGLGISVIIGGMITSWILMAGTLSSSFTTFSDLANQFQIKIGYLGVTALGVGLFAAGLSSAITAPYAASIITSNVFGVERRSIVRLVWASVLAIGFIFGFSGLKPIPVILSVQALNGLILPLLTFFLILISNDKKLIPDSGRHSLWYNIILISVFASVLLLGLNNIDKVCIQLLELKSDHFEVILLVSLALSFFLGWKILRTSYK